MSGSPGNDPPTPKKSCAPSGYHASATYPMPKVARSLSPAEAEALASYLSYAR
jgi:hypothetical protein